MKNVTFCTGNNGKVEAGRSICSQYNINVEHKNIDIDEVQSEDFNYIAQQKAISAYKIVGSPVLISDDCYNFPGLNGFPGPYMHSLNKWFSVDDFVYLIKGMKDRRLFIHKFLAYYDGNEVKLFETIHEGMLLTEPRGESTHNSHKIMAMNGENGLTVAEVTQDKVRLHKRPVLESWRQFAEWYSAK